MAHGHPSAPEDLYGSPVERANTRTGPLDSAWASVDVIRRGIESTQTCLMLLSFVQLRSIIPCCVLFQCMMCHRAKTMDFSKLCVYGGALVQLAHFTLGDVA